MPIEVTALLVVSASEVTAALAEGSGSVALLAHRLMPIVAMSLTEDIQPEK